MPIACLVVKLKTLEFSSLSALCPTTPWKNQAPGPEQQQGVTDTCASSFFLLMDPQRFCFLLWSEQCVSSVSLLTVTGVTIRSNNYRMVLALHMPTVSPHPFSIHCNALSPQMGRTRLQETPFQDCRGL